MKEEHHQFDIAIASLRHGYHYQRARGAEMDNLKREMAAQAA